ARRDERGRVFWVRLHIVQWRVFVERFEFLRVFARAVIRSPGPTDGEFLKAEHVEHADNGQRCTPQVRALRQTSADEQTAVAATVDRQLRPRRVMSRDEPFTCGAETITDSWFAQFSPVEM